MSLPPNNSAEPASPPPARGHVLLNRREAVTPDWTDKAMQKANDISVGERQLS